MRSLHGKTVVLTGAASGIGKSLAVLLASRGARLALLDKDEGGLSLTKSLCVGGNARAFPVDVANRDQVDEVARAMVRDFPGVDVLINNAGVSSSGAIQELTEATLRWTMDINFWGTVNCTRAFLPHLQAREEAALVNVSSVYGLIGVPGQAAYCASKFAVRGFTEAIRQDLRGSGVTVTLVFPGGVRTNIVRSSRSDASLSPDVQAAARQIFEASLRTSPDDAARAIVRGIERGLPRVLVGRDAGKIDRLARLLPGHYDAAVARSARKLHDAVARAIPTPKAATSSSPESTVR